MVRRRGSRVLTGGACVLLLVACSPGGTSARGALPNSVVSAIDVRIGDGEDTREYRLVMGVERLTKEMSAKAAYDSSQGCPDDGNGQPVELTVHLGSTAIPVLVEPFGCQLVAGWGQDRGGGQAVSALLFELLERQRVATPVADPVPAACPDPLYAQLTIGREPSPHWDAITVLDADAVGPPYPAVGARICHYQQTNAGPTTQRLLDAEQAEALRLQTVGDLTLTYYPCALETDQAYALVFVDAAGGSFEVRVDASRCFGIASNRGYGRAGLGLKAALTDALQ